jgi:hypothetical protein
LRADHPLSRRIEAFPSLRVALWLVGLAAAAYLLLYGALAVFRVPYSFELEWLEGSVVDVVHRILLGQKIYVEPSVEFASHAYTPLYFYVSAAASKLFGIGFLPLRLVSLLSILGVFALLFLWARRETGGAYWGLLAAGLFAATFRAAGAWFDVARVDSLFLFLLLWASYQSRFAPPSLGGAAIAGLLFFLAYFTKQSALPVAACVGAHLLLVDWRRALVFASVLAATVGLSAVVLDRIHDGWYLYYTVELIRQHPLVPALALPFWTDYLLGPLPLVCAVSLAFLARRVAERRREALFYPALAAGMLGVAWSSRLHLGGYDNVLLPAYAILALLFALGIHEGLQVIQRSSLPWRHAAMPGLLALCLLQYGWLFYDPFEQVPTRADAAAGEELLQRIRQIDGEVYLPFHGFLGTLAGKRSYAHINCLGDIYRGTDVALQQQITEDVNEALRNGRFAAVIWDFGRIRFDELERNYERLPARLFDDPKVFRPVTGGRYRPETVFLRRR